MKICKLLLAATGATVLLSALVAGAAARNLSVSNQSIRAYWREVRFTTSFAEIKCEVTLEGSLHTRTMAKTIGSLIGYVTRDQLGFCGIGTATILRETLPWHVRYSSFNGFLPEIASVIMHVVGAAWRIREPLGVTCLFRSSAERPVVGTFHRSTSSHEVSEVAIGGGIPSGGECFNAVGTLTSNSGPISVLGTLSTRITVTLI